MPAASSIAAIIGRKRDALTLPAEDIRHFVRGLADGSVPVEQAAALAMAIYLNGMDNTETAALTDAFVRSGEVINWHDAGLHGPVLDKHSTGGVGDKVSLILAPVVAACGGYVPMISGRGLGHTGGTLDKMASIPGYDPFPGLDRFREVVRHHGCAIIGQTGELAPADRRMYAIRDITATIESFPLITASILSKKVAAGVTGLVMDIKTGSGAFMAQTEQAHALARSLIGSAGALGVTCHALITDMNEVLGTTAGNALEVGEAIACLTDTAREHRLYAITIALAAEMLVIGGLAQDHAEAQARAEDALASGKAAETFGRMVAALGGPVDLLDRPEKHLPRAPVSLPIFAQSPGYLTTVDVRAIGEAIIDLAGGRRTADDRIDPRTGFSDVVPIGTKVVADQPLAIVHAADETAAKRGLAEFSRACIVAPEKPAPGAVIHAIELPRGPGGK